MLKMKSDTFSKAEIETIAHRAFDGEQVQVLNYDFERYSKDKVGFLGNHQNLEITVKRNDNGEPQSHRFFVKSMPQLTEDQLKIVREQNFFGHEASYFNDILPLLKKFCPNTEEWSPKCLLASDQFVVLEDVRLRNYAMSSTKMLNEDQLKAAFKAQARLHAASLVAEKQLGKTLNEVYPNSFDGTLFSEEMLKHKRLELYIDLAEKIAERLGRDGRRISAGFRQGFYQMYDQSRLSTKLPKILEHGDAWPNNYMFDTSNPPKCILVDYQLIRYGPPMYDSVILAYLGTTREFREKTIGKAIEAYHQQFCEVLQKNDPEIEKPTLDDVFAEYEELRSTALLCAVMYYPIIWLDQSTVDKYDEEERYKKIMFRQDNAFVMQIYDEDDVFAARINDIVEEAVEYFERRGMSVEEKIGVH